MAAVTQHALNTLRRIASRNVTGNEGISYLWSVEEVNYEGLRVNFDFSVMSSIHDESDSGATGTSNGVIPPPVGGSRGKLTGWCMLRPSLHEPILSMQIESDQIGGSKQAALILLSGSPDIDDTTVKSIDKSYNSDNPNPTEFQAFNQLSHLMDISQLISLASK